MSGREQKKKNIRLNFGLVRDKSISRLLFEDFSNVGGYRKLSISYELFSWHFFSLLGSSTLSEKITPPAPNGRKSTSVAVGDKVGDGSHLLHRFRVPDMLSFLSLSLLHACQPPPSILARERSDWWFWRHWSQCRCEGDEGIDQYYVVLRIDSSTVLAKKAHAAQK